MESAKSLSDLSVAEDAIRCKLQAVSDMEETEREIYKKVREESSWELQGGEEDVRKDVRKAVELSRMGRVLGIVMGSNGEAYTAGMPVGLE